MSVSGVASIWAIALLMAIDGDLPIGRITETMSPLPCRIDGDPMSAHLRIYGEVFELILCQVWHSAPKSLAFHAIIARGWAGVDRRSSSGSPRHARA
jgi:hypothetical protein